MKRKQSQVGAAAVKAAIAEMEAGKIVFTVKEAKSKKRWGLRLWNIRSPVVACALANHPEIVRASDHGLLKLAPYLDVATFDEVNGGLMNDAFKLSDSNDVAGVGRNIRRVTNDVQTYLDLVVESASRKTFTSFHPHREAEFLYIAERGKCRLYIEPDPSDTEHFFTGLWSCLEQSSSEYIRRCKCGRYFIAKTGKARFCSSACGEAVKRERYAKSPDRAEDQALSMMAVNYRRRPNGGTPSKRYAANWLETYRKKRQRKKPVPKPVSTRPVETVLAKLSQCATKLK